MSTIMGIIGPEHPKLFALELGKITEFDFINTLASTNINQSIPNLVKLNTTIRSQISSFMDVIGSELLSVLEIEKMPYMTLFTL